MNRTLCLGLAILLSGFGVVAHAGEKAAVLDGTSWKVHVEPDAMAKKAGEKEFKDTLTFVDGKVSMSEYKKMGFESAPYTASKSGEKDWTFSSDPWSDSQGTTVWTGNIDGDSVKGKMIWTKKDGSVLTYTFEGHKLE